MIKTLLKIILKINLAKIYGPGSEAKDVVIV